MHNEVDDLTIVELKMMDKRKYFPLTLSSSLLIRGLLYPVALIKTRLQIQRGTEVYKGTFDAFMKISQTEGITGLYRGFWVTTLQVVPSMAYISTYESIRHYMMEHTSFTEKRLRSFIAGGSASIIGQTIAVPIDIVSQHLMMLGGRKKSMPIVDKKISRFQRIHIPDSVRTSRFGAVTTIIKEIYRLDKLAGFYKGYFVSLAVFAPNSALWWFFYDVYQDALSCIVPTWIPRLVLQTCAAPLGGVSAALLTNPLDVIRARMQVEGTPLAKTVRILWREEHLRIITKGLSARLVQSISYSFFIILGYESVKRWSLLDEYKDSVRW